jgi:hypothetical protein
VRRKNKFRRMKNTAGGIFLAPIRGKSFTYSLFYQKIKKNFKKTQIFFEKVLTNAFFCGKLIIQSTLTLM